MVTRRPLPGERGQILILTALMMTVFLGIAALSIDASYMYDTRNKLYAAADAAAKSAAIEVHRGNSAHILPFAQRQVIAHGFALADVALTVRLCNDGAATCKPPFAGDKHFVEVIVSKATPTFFGKVFGIASLTPGARAVAGMNESANCVIALGPTSPGINIGTSTIEMPNCSIFDNTALSNGGTIHAKDIFAASCDDNCDGVTISATPMADPLEALRPPPDPGGSCAVPPVPLTISGEVTISAGRFCGWDLGNNATLHLSAGVYYIAGPITGGNNVTIDNPFGGVMIYLAVGGSFVLDKNDPTVTLSASTDPADPYRAILFYQHPDNPNPAQFGKNSGQMNLSGAMYFPNADVTTAKNNGILANDCSLFVAKSIDMKNNAALSNTCSAYGGSPVATVSMAE